MDGEYPRPCSRGSSAHTGSGRKSSWAKAIRPSLKASRTGPDLAFFDIDVSSFEGGDAWKGLDNIAALGLTLDVEDDEFPARIIDFQRFYSMDDDGGNYSSSPEKGARGGSVGKPFHKWMKSLKRRGQRPGSTTYHIHHHHQHGSVDESFPVFMDEPMSSGGHRKSSSDSSFGYVEGVRSASMSLASASVLNRSRRNTARSSHCAKTDRSSRASFTGTRLSVDSVRPDLSMMVDPAVTERLLQRRRILEELISTEESYIGDIKFLMNVYVTILAALPTQHMGLRSSINRNLTEIVELHEEILGELHRVVPNSEYTQAEPPLPSTQRPVGRSGHTRWRSLDSVPERKGGAARLQDIPSMTADPNVAAEVARVFCKRMNRFFAYEEYGAKYEMMIKDVASAHRSLPQWETYQKGLEALAASLGSVNHHLDHSRKSLTIGDLLVKPIQRICRYPLLFAELLKHTPVCDCPSSHADIENVLARLREATAEINRATDDPSVKATMEKTWLLQDRLTFPDKCLDGAIRTTIRSLGQIQLCGVLHVCWQTRETVVGQYMIILLYKDCLCLATADRVEQMYTIQACIGLDTIKLEEADNGRGLQCHTAPFSFKVVFEVDHQLYEIILTACSSKEETEWRNWLAGFIPSEMQDHHMEPQFCSSLSLNIKSLGTVFGKPGTIARRLSIHRATTVGPKSPLCQVLLKNTTTLRETSHSNLGPPINRSQSLLTTNSRVPVLAPSRGERARLEVMLSDVWSRSILPFPGITTRSRSEHLVRSSASTMMRKLSVASITGSFTRRSASNVSLSNMNRDRATTWNADDMEPPPPLPVTYHGNNSFVDAINNMALNCDFSSPPLNMDAELDDVQQRLPVIRDETERTGSCTPSHNSLPPTTATSVDTSSVSMAGTVRRLDVSKLDAQWQTGEGASPRPRTPSVLRTSSANSLRQQTNRASPSVKSISPVLSEKENLHDLSRARSHIQEATTTKNSGRPSKLSKVVNRGLVSRGLRSIFR